MSNLQEMITELTSMAARMRFGAKLALYAEAETLKGEFEARSPVDSGKYKMGWRVVEYRFAMEGCFGAVSIYNNTEEYGQFMEFGATPNQPPWYFPKGPDGKTKKRTGKLKLEAGMIWAGGISPSPGHSMTVGGAGGAGLVNNSRRLSQLATSIADGVIGAIA